jgi:hypothetical protein
MTVKPSPNEEQQFAQMEFEPRKKVAQVQTERLVLEEEVRLKMLHWMRCPKDGSELLETSLRGVTVDICSTCGGIWLDNGELDVLTQTDKAGVLSSFRKLLQG